MRPNGNSQFDLRSVFWAVTVAAVWFALLRISSTTSFFILLVATISVVVVATLKSINSYPVVSPFFPAFALVGWMGLARTLTAKAYPGYSLAYATFITSRDYNFELSFFGSVYLTATVASALAAGSLAYLLRAAYLKYRRR